MHFCNRYVAPRGRATRLDVTAISIGVFFSSALLAGGVFSVHCARILGWL